MRQAFYLDTDAIFERACNLRGFELTGNLTFSELYKMETERNGGFKSGELEQATWESMQIPVPARHGFAVTHIEDGLVIVQDLEEINACDLTDPDDEHLKLPVEQFREWLYNWSKEPINRVMDTAEAAKLWGYEHPDSVKALCLQGKVKARKMTKGWIIDRNQPNPRQVAKKQHTFSFEDVQGTLTLSDDGYYEFVWGGIETTLKFRNTIERDAFLLDNQRIGKLIDQTAHAEATLD